MSDMDRFEAWWNGHNIHDPTLKAIALSAWMMAISARKPQPQPQPAEDPDEWVIQDRVPARPGVDERRYIWSDGGVGSWADCAVINWSVPTVHGMNTPTASATVELRCRRRDLPKVEQPEQWPKYWTKLDPADSKVAYVKQVSKSQGIIVYAMGHESDEFPWCKDDSQRNQLTEAEAMAMLKKPEPQPQKTRVRLWMRCELKGRPSVFACAERPYPDSNKYVEIHHDADGFYVENQP